MAFLEQTWKTFIPHLPFDFYFVDKRVRGSYQSEIHLTRSADPRCRFGLDPQIFLPRTLEEFRLRRLPVRVGL